MRKFQNLYKRVASLLHSNASAQEINRLVNKLKTTYSRLEKMQYKAGVIIAGTTLAIMLSSATTKSQTFATGVNLQADGVAIDVGDYFAAPTFADIDRDGDLDLYVGSFDYDTYNYRIKIFTNDGEGTFSANGNLQADGSDISIPAKPVFQDIDRDGDLDLYAGNINGTVNVFTNDGSGNFSGTGALRADGVAIDVGYYSTPTFADIDRDGDLDLYVGESYGYINVFINDGSGNFNAAGNLQADGSDIDIGSYTAPTFSDLDRDGDLDLIVGGQDGTLNQYTNDGSGNFSAVGKLKAAGSDIDVGEYSKPVFADIDRDGDQDLYVGNNDGKIQFFENTETPPTPKFVTGEFVQADGSDIDLALYSKPVFADIDRDGDLDLYVGEYDNTAGYSYLKSFMNNGEGNFTAAGNFQADGSDIKLQGPSLNPTFADIDRDGDQDLYVGEYNGYILAYRNDGNGVFSFLDTLQADAADLDVGSFAAPTFADIDRDGDQDLYVGEYFGYVLTYHNDGNGVFSFADTVQADGSNLDLSNISTPAFADIDNDGDIDLYAGMVYGNVFYCLNDGSGNFEVMTPIVVDEALWQVNGLSNPAFADIDNDGDLDLFSGDADGKVTIFENQLHSAWNGTAWDNQTPDARFDSIFVDGDLAISEALDARNLVVNPGNNLTVSAELNLTGQLTLRADATGAASLIDNAAINTDSATVVELYQSATTTTPYWHYAAVPVDVSGGTVTSEVFGTPYTPTATDYYAFYFDEINQQYQPITDNSTVLTEQLRGYAIPSTSANTLAFEGDLVTGAQSITPTRQGTGSFEGHNLCGNPYPSGIDLATTSTMAGITATNLVETAWIRESGNFITYNWASGTSTSGFDGIVPPMQAIWFRVIDGQTDGTLQFDNTARVHDNDIVYKQPETNVFKLTATLNGRSDEVITGFYDQASDGFDAYDSEKMFTDNLEFPQIYTVLDGKELAINGFDNNLEGQQIVPLAYKTSQPGEFTFEATNIGEFDPNIKVYLKDKAANKIVDLGEENNYSFYAQAPVNNAGRFELVFTDQFTGIEEAGMNGINIFANDETVYLRTPFSGDAIVMVSDITGSIIQSEEMHLEEGLNSFAIDNAKGGIYFITLNMGEEVVTEKVVLK